MEPVDEVLAESRGLEYVARDLEAVDQRVDVVLGGEVVCVYAWGLEGVCGGEGDVAFGFRPEKDGAQRDVVLCCTC